MQTTVKVNMSLGCLAELVSVTGEAVRSLNNNKTESSDEVNKAHYFNAGSPFESPRSFQSVSVKCEILNKILVENTQSSSALVALPSCDFINANEAPDSESNGKFVDIKADKLTVKESINYTDVGSSYKTNCSDKEYSAVSNNRVKHLSISNKQLLEVTAPEEHIQNLQSSISSKGTKISGRQDRDYFPTVANSTDKVSVECHKAKSNAENMNSNWLLAEEMHLKESLNSLSSSGEQPEIIDVHQRIATITSGMSQSSDDSTEVLPGDPNWKHFPSGKSEQGHGLKQGALTRGPMDPTKASLFNDVYISQFGLTEKQRGLKSALAKRSESNMPKKKFVQPQIIHRNIVRDRDIDESGNDHPTKPQAVFSANDTIVTAAAAASAAVAAAQPFLKTQHELEARIQQLMEQISNLQQKTSSTETVRTTSGSENRIQDLERNVAELTERRFEHLENLQHQQMQLQAQLLLASQSRNHSHLGYTARPSQISHIPRAAARQPDRGSHPTEHTSYSSSVPGQPTYKPTAHSQATYSANTHSQSSFNPDTLQKHHNYLSEVRELQGSHLATPAPRDRVPKPAPYTLPHEPQKNFGFLQELLARKDTPDKDTTYSVMGDYSSPARLESDRNNSARGKQRHQSPVDKARQLVTSLSNLEKETADSIWGSRDGLNKMPKVHVDLGPAPLDQYLKYPEKEGSPYPKLGHHSKHKKKLLENVDNLWEAKNVLRQLEETREILEKNIDQVVKSRNDIHLFTTLPGCEPDLSTNGQLRIEKIVTKKISALEGDIQREVLKGLAVAEAEKLAAQQELELAAKRKLEQARSSTQKGQMERTARSAYSKPNVVATATLTSRGKENRESKVRLPPKPTVIKDEATRTRTYGKPEYQRGRTTIRDPYLHINNPKKGVAAKVSLTNLNESARSREGRSRSPPKHGREPVVDPMPRQYYFSPTRGYIPLGGGDTAPVQGHLVSMAIPLGAPRLEPGVRRSAGPVTRSSSGPVSSTPITAARNVAMVSFPVDRARHGQTERQPELTKEVLPPIDIDSISPSSSQRSEIHIRSPQQDNANVTFLYNSRNEVEADEANATLTEESSELEQSGEGIQLPGYEPKVATYSGPSFPLHVRKPGPGCAVSSGEGVTAQQMSDVMADDMRRRDMLENNAVIWLEQELMARVLSQVPLQDKPVDVSQQASEASDKDESLLVADMIGHGGMQLFIDAGQPVDNALVQELIKDVIREKVLAMMAERDTEGQGQAKVRSEVKEAVEEETEKLAPGSQRVVTPTPTPKSSPIPSPRKAKQRPPQPVTPTQSPPPDGYRWKPVEADPQVLSEPVRQPPAAVEPPRVLTVTETDSEASLSLDISEELRRVAAKGKSAETVERGIACYDVATPPLSPQPIAEEKKPEGFPERQATPPITPPLAKTPPRVRTPSPRRQDAVSDSQEEEEQEEEIVEQPQPIKISVGVGNDSLLTVEAQTQHRSPPPQRPLTPVSTTSETSSLSTETTTTDTINEFISEGQWLLSYSEGQVVGAVNYQAIRKEIAGKGYEHIIDVSTASTLRDTDDLDLDIEGTRSEGEFLYGGFPDPAKDPRLEVLAQLQKRTIHVQQMYHGSAPTVALSSTGRSFGEMSIGQVPPAQVAADRARKHGGHLQRERERQARSPSPMLERNQGEVIHSRPDTPQNRGREFEQRHRAQSQVADSHSRTQSPEFKSHSRTASPLQKPSGQTSAPVHQKRSSTPPQQDRRSKTPPFQRQRESAGGTRAKAQIQYQPVLSDGRPISAKGRTGKQSRHRSSDVTLSQTSDPGVRRSDSTYNSQSLSRSADGDSFRRSANGFLTSSLKSRNSAVKKSVEFDLSGTQQSMKRGSRDLSDHGEPSISAASTYTEDSLDESELRRIGTVTGMNSYAGTYRMSVTIPSGAEGQESEVSEVDLSNKSDK